MSFERVKWTMAAAALVAALGLTSVAVDMAAAQGTSSGKSVDKKNDQGAAKKAKAKKRKTVECPPNC
jgi:hypothetical protein